MLVVACNTASAVALHVLRKEFAPRPVIGVVEPGAEAATALRPGGSHLVLATETTVRLGAYRRAILERDSDARVTEHACELLVALAEEGWMDGDIATAIVSRYLAEAWPSSEPPNSIILGCTHFPLLRPAIEATASERSAIVDSASTTAAVTADTLAETGLSGPRDSNGRLVLLASDGAKRFARVGGRFLGAELDISDVELVDI
jgi:glutamate racemase